MTGEAAVSVTATATLCVDVGWVRWQIDNEDAANTVWYGYDNSVTKVNGTRILPGGSAYESRPYPNSPAPTIYAIADTAKTADCRVLVVTPAANQG